MTRGEAIRKAIQATALAGLTWLALYLAKEHLGRGAALALAGIILLAVVLLVLARAQHKRSENTESG
jgi:hypothetical protein